MINGKFTYLLCIYSQKEEDDFQRFVLRMSGKQFPMKNIYKTISNCNHDRSTSICIETTLDFKEAKITRLTGFCSHIGYPSSRAFFGKSIYNFIDWYEHEYLVTNNLSIVKHIPHASLALPKHFSGIGFKYIYKMTDIGVDELFKNVNGIEVKAPYNRLFCDVERLKDDKKEPMAKFGQGYKYTKTYDGNLLTIVTDLMDFDWDKYIDEYYDEHHAKLNEAVKNELDKGKDVLVLDCHSFSDELADSIGKVGPYPDICIGINKDFNNEPLLNLIIKKIEEKGLNYKINYPYEGAIVPTDVANGVLKGNVYCIMIEVNKRLYL